MGEDATRLSHVDDEGRARMVDVGDKDDTVRKAVAGCTVRLSAETFAMLQEKALPKGDVLNTAKVAGVMAAKKTSELIPMCHPLFLNYVDVSFEPDPEKHEVRITAETRTTGKTGVEMEALAACQVAALTIYDMCKAVQKDIIIDDCKLLHKSGGRSGVYDAP